MNKKTDMALYHEVKTLSSGKRELHIWAYGIDLTGGERTLTSKVESEIAEDKAYFDLLNTKAAKLSEEDPKWVITSLSDWRSWAKSYRTEFFDMYTKQLAKEIIANRDKILAEKGLV